MEQTKNGIVGKKCIVRCNNSGVFYGEVTLLAEKFLYVKNVRRIWYWSGAASLSEMAVKGVKYPNNCRFSVVVPEEYLFDVIEILPVTKIAATNIEEVPEWISE